MLELNPIGSNQTLVEGDDFVVLFSYRTPVAAFISGRGYFRTAKHWSAATSRHINGWLGTAFTAAGVKPQAWFDNLLSPAELSKNKELAP